MYNYKVTYHISIVRGIQETVSTIVQGENIKKVRARYYSIGGHRHEFLVPDNAKQVSSVYVTRIYK